MKHMKKTLAAFLLTLALALVIGLVPGMMGTAYADATDNVTPLTFEAKGDGVTVSLKWASGSAEYKQGNNDWENYTQGTAITLSQGETVQFRGNSIKTDVSNHFTVTGSCSVYGNVMSLLYGPDFTSDSAREVPEKAFGRLFDQNTALLNDDTKDLVLPATTLGNYCYTYMFNGCTSLTRAPELPATTLASIQIKDIFSIKIKKIILLTIIS